MVFSSSRSSLRIPAFVLAGCFWLAGLLPAFAQLAPQLTGTLPNVVTRASGSSVAVNAAAFFKAQDAPGTVVRLTIVSGTTLVSGSSLASGTNTIYLALTDSLTPLTVANFLSYVRSGAYNNSFFHRSNPLMPDYSNLPILQGGGFRLADGTSDLNSSTLRGMPAAGSILNEADPSRPNVRGTIAMARTDDPNSATSGWFFNVGDNSGGSGWNGAGTGYTVFGTVIGNGMAVVDQISALPTSDLRTLINGAFADIPLREVLSGTSVPRSDLVVVQSAEIVPSLSFNAVPVDPTVAQVVNVSADGVVTLAPGSVSGTTDVVVTATDLDLLSTSGTFSVVNAPTGATLVSLGVASMNVSGAAGTAVVHVVRSGTGAFTVQYATADGTAHAGSEYTPVNSSLTFTPTGSNDQTVSITVANQLVPPPGKAFTFQLSSTGAGVTLATPSATTINILDNSANPGGVLQFSQAVYETDAGVGAVTVQITRTGDPSSTVSTVVSTLDGSATNGVDYTGLLSQVVTFGPGDASSKAVVIPVYPTGLASGQRSFNVSLSGLTGGAIAGSNSSASVLIHEQAPAGGVFAFVVPEFRCTGTSARILVQRLGNTGTTASVYFSTSNGTALAGTHYTGISGIMNFTAGQTSWPLDIPLLATADTQNRTVFLSLSSPSANAAVGLAGGSATLVIANAPQTGVVQFNSPVFLSYSSVGFNTILTRTGPTTQPATVLVELEDNTAVRNYDYATFDAYTHLIGPIVPVQFAAGSGSATLPIYLGDLTGKSFTLRLLTAPEGSAIGQQVEAVSQYVQFEPATMRMAESVGSVVAVVTRSGTEGTVSVEYATADGTAVDGINYSGTNGTLTFNPGDTQKTITVPLIATSGSSAPDCNFVVNLISATGAAFIANSGSSNVTIVKNAPSGTFSLSATSYRYASDAWQHPMVVRSATGQAATAWVEAIDGTSLFGTDYLTGTSGRLMRVDFAANQAAVALNIAQYFNNGSLGMSLLLVDSSSGSAIGTPNAAAVTFFDAPVVQFDVANCRVSESNATATLTVRRTYDTSGTVTVQYATADGSARSGVNYSGTSNLLTFLPGETQKPVTVSLIRTTASTSPDLSFTVALFNAGGGASVGSNSAASITIVKNPTTGVYSFDQSAYRFIGGASSEVIAVNRSGASLGTSGTAVVEVLDGSYSLDPSLNRYVQFTFAPNETQNTLDLGALSHSGSGDYTLVVRLVWVSAGAAVGTPDATLLTFLDGSRPAGLFEFSSPTYSGSESAGTVPITVTRSGTAGQATVHVTMFDGSAINGTDYVAQPGDLTFAPGVQRLTFQAQLINGSQHQGANRTFTVALSNPTNGAGIGVTNQATISIVDDNDPGVFEFTSTTFSGSETSGTALVTVTRSGAATTPATVHVSMLDGSAINGTDYHAQSGDLPFAAGTRSLTFQALLIPGVQHPGVDRTFTVALSNATNGTGIGTKGRATVSIVDDNNFGVCAFLQSSYRADESAGIASLTVVRSGTAGDVTVHYSTADGSAKAGTDYRTVTAGEVHFLPGVQIQTIQVPLINDAKHPTADRVFTVALSNPGAGFGIVQPSQATVSIVDDDDPAGVFQFESSDYAFNQNAGWAELTVIRSNGTAKAADVILYTLDDSASTLGRNTLYRWPAPAAALGLVVHFEPGQTRQKMFIPLIDGAVTGSSPAYFEAYLVRGGTGSIGYQNTALIAVSGPTPPSPEVGLVEFDSNEYRVNDTDATIVLHAKRYGSAAGSVSVPFQLFPSSTAANGTDFNLVPAPELILVGTLNGILTFPAGVTAVNLPIAIKHSAASTGEKQFSVQLGAPNSGAALLAQTNARVTIVNRTATLGVFEMEKPTCSFDQDCGTALVTVIRKGTAAQLSGSAQVIVTTEDGSAIGRRYDANGNDLGFVNFAANRQMLNFARGETSKTFPVQLLGAITGTSANLLVRIDSATTGARAGACGRAVVTVLNPTMQGKAAFDFAKPYYLVNETAGTLTVTVRRVNTTASASDKLSVGYTLVNGTAKSGVDFKPKAMSGTLTFPRGVNSAQIVIPILNRNLTQNRTFSLKLSNPRDLTRPSNPVGLLAANPVPVTVRGSASPFGVIQFDKAAYSVAANARTFPLVLLRSGALGASATVLLHSADASAIGGRDYTAFDQIITFAPGQSRFAKIVTITNAHGKTPRYFVVQLLPTPKSQTGAMDATAVTVRPK